MKKLKVVLYTHSLSGGGAERALAVLATGLARRQHDVLLVTDTASLDNEPYVIADVRRHALGQGHVRTVFELSRLISRERPDACISALCSSNLKLSAAAANAGSLDRVILTYHGFFESEPQLLSRLGYLLTPVLSRITARTVAVSNALRTNLVNHWRSSPARTCRIYNPVVWGEASNGVSESSLLSRDNIILASGRLIASKNFDGLIRAFAKMKCKAARLIIIGEGPERKSLEAEMDRLGLQLRVELPGYVREPWDYYARASCFVLSSRIETFGMVVAEALAHGLPVVSTSCIGPLEILGNAGLGSVVPLGDEDAMAAAIDAALEFPGSPLARMARAAAFAAPYSVDAYEDLISNVTRSARNRSFTHEESRISADSTIESHSQTRGNIIG